MFIVMLPKVLLYLSLFAAFNFLFYGLSWRRYCTQIVSNSYKFNNYDQNASANSSHRTENINKISKITTQIVHSDNFDPPSGIHKTLTTYPPYILNKKNSNSRKTIERVILIFARYRTGSTFISEIFNHHDKFFYLFEPLKLVATSSNHVNNVNKWLSFVFSCKFNEIWDGAIENPIHSNESLPGWKRKIFCYKHNQSDDCTSFSFQKLEEICNSYPFIAIKDIHIQYLETIKPAITRGLPVIYVVRDPRGVISSQMNVHWGLNQTKTKFMYDIYYKEISNWVTNYCSEVNRDLPSIKTILSQGQSNRKTPFIIVRYEDFVLNMTAKTKEIYQMTNIQPSQSVFKWIAESYNETSSDDLDELTFGTKRKNIFGPVYAWRSHLWWELIDQIQGKCMDMMNYFGYKPVTNITLNNKDFVTF